MRITRTAEGKDEIYIVQANQTPSTGEYFFNFPDVIPDGVQYKVEFLVNRGGAFYQNCTVSKCCYIVENFVSRNNM